MPRECRHVRHEVAPQQNIWKGAKFKRVQPAMVYCSDCGTWLFDKPINWDLVPKNKTERMEARIDDSRSGRKPAQPTRDVDEARATHAGQPV